MVEKQPPKIEHLSTESIQNVYQTKSVKSKQSVSKKSLTNPSDPLLFYKDTEALKMELDQSKQIISSIQKEKRDLIIKIRGLEESLSKVEQTHQQHSYNPYDKSFKSAHSLRNNDSSSKSTATIQRQYESKLKAQQEELEQIKKTMRFTKLVELENELKIYYQEMSRMKNAYEDQGNIHSLFEQLSKYKNAVKEVLTRAQKLSDREFQLKTVHHDLMQERNELRKHVTELKNQIKIQSKVMEENFKLQVEIEDARKREKDHELEKVRMNASSARDKQELESIIANLRIQLGESGTPIKIDRRRSSVLHPNAALKNKKHDHEGSFGNLKKNPSHSFKNLIEEDSPFSRPASALN